MSTLENEPSVPQQPRFTEKLHATDSDLVSNSSEGAFSKRFNAADSDVTFQSSDGVLFRLHKLNLAVNAKLPELLTSDAVVALSENSEVLELLFQFCYPQRHPDLESIDVNILVSLAEAAERYQVFPAITVCNIRMRESVSQSPFNVMLYAARHGYTDILDMSYKFVLKEPLDETITKLPPHLVIPWVLHYERYARILRQSITLHGTFHGKTMVTPIKHQKNCRMHGSSVCHCCHVLQNLGKGVSALIELDTIFSCSCDKSPKGLKAWRQALEEDVKMIPPFHTLL